MRERKKRETKKGAAAPKATAPNDYSCDVYARASSVMAA